MTTHYLLISQADLLQYYNHIQFSFTLLRPNHSKDETGNISGSTGSTTLTTNQIPSHLHGTPRGLSNATMEFAFSGTCGGAGKGTSTCSSNTGGGQSHDHTLSANFSGSANSVLQPYLVLIYIIKT